MRIEYVVILGVYFTFLIGMIVWVAWKMKQGINRWADTVEADINKLKKSGDEYYASAKAVTAEFKKDKAKHKKRMKQLKRKYNG